MMNWQEIQERHAALSLREKGLILLTSLVLIVFSVGSFVIEPSLKTLAKSKERSQSIQQSIDAAITQRSEIERKIASDPRGQLEAQLSGLARKHLEVVRLLAEKELLLVSSDEMAAALQILLSENKGLTVETLASIAPQVILYEQKTAAKDTPKPLLYRHGVKIKIKGTFFAVVKFLQQIELKSQYLLWGDIDYVVEQYPNALVTFEVYTISGDEEFIGVK